MMNAVEDRIEEPLEHVLDPKLQAELDKYPNKWVAMTRSEILAVGDNVATVRKEAHNLGVDNPIIYFVPEPDVLFIL